MSDIVRQNVEQISIVNHSFPGQRRLGGHVGSHLWSSSTERWQRWVSSHIGYSLPDLEHTLRDSVLFIISLLNSSPDQVVAESMNNYLMFDRLLKCSVVPKVGTKRSLCGEKDNIRFHFGAGEN